MKTAQNTNQAWDIQERFNGQPHAWIQWKGTDVCMDVHCECGAHLHFDGDFAYHIKCEKCEAVYFMSGFIEMIKLKDEPDHCVQIARG